MSLPTSGTYRLSILGLKDYSIINGGSTDPYAIYTIGSGNNFAAYDVDVTFTATGFSFVDANGITRNITYNQDYLLGQANYKYDSIITQSSSDPNFYYYISAEPSDTIKERTPQSLSQQSNDPTNWFFGDNPVLMFKKSNSTQDAFKNLTPDCFLPGTLISTPKGNTSIEFLKVGDTIFTYKNGITKIDKVKWIGKSYVVIRNNLPNDESGYPVRVLKNAISDGVPFKDMLITSEHCLFFNGGFIPARMLVNNSSIIYDKSFLSYEYYHIATENHSVIMADGMLTESYLDTGSRNSFSQGGKVFYLQSNIKTWEEDAIAPLTVSRSIVEPIYHEIENRAKKLHFKLQETLFDTLELTEKTNLRLKTDSGNIIYPTHQIEDKFLFFMPDKTKSIQILSRFNRPCDIFGPFVDDRRKLGVLVGNITLSEKEKAISFSDHLENKDLQGWHKIESTSMRWTTENAEITLPSNKEKIEQISIQIISGGPYFIDKKNNVNLKKAV